MHRRKYRYFPSFYLYKYDKITKCVTIIDITHMDTAFLFSLNTHFQANVKIKTV